MPKLLGWLLLLLVFTPLAHANKHFIISPYTLKADNGDIHLKFQTQKKVKLNVSIIRNGTENIDSIQEVEATPEKLINLNLGHHTCDNNLGYNITMVNGALEEKLVNTNLPSFECHIYDEFTFGFISDTQSKPKNHKKVADAMVKHLEKNKINFVLHTGDITHVGGENERWLNFFNVAQSYLGGRPIMAAIGNHSYWKDKTNKPLPELFQKYMRWEGSEEIGYMTAIYPLFQMVIINSNFDKLVNTEVEKQFAWLEQTLKEAQLQNRTTMVAMHYPPFSTSFFQASKAAKFLRKYYVPLFEKYGVKLVLTGHTHVYERSFKDGVNYVIAGPAGGIRGIPMGRNKHRVMADTFARTFTTIKVTKDQISLKTMNHKRKEIDKLTIDL